MGRHVTPRGGNYDQDATVVLRIVKAIEGDGAVTSEWRSRAASKLREAAQELLQPEHVATSMGRGKGG